MECLKFYERAEKSDVINSRLIQVSAFKEKYALSLVCVFDEYPFEKMSCALQTLLKILIFNI